jgi:hypothetical protein
LDSYDAKRPGSGHVGAVLDHKCDLLKWNARKDFIGRESEESGIWLEDAQLSGECDPLFHRCEVFVNPELLEQPDILGHDLDDAIDAVGHPVV